jgi:hypothetical protein
MPTEPGGGSKQSVGIHRRPEISTDEPGIDVVITTLNCDRALDECLRRIRAQTYSGELTIDVVDGGSSDKTIEIAEEFGCRVHVKPGMYCTGTRGGRQYGLSLGSAEFVWFIDSDNFLVETTVARDVVRPLVRQPGLNISLPETAVYPKASSFNNYLCLREIDRVNRMKSLGKTAENVCTVEQLSYGITNASMLRRSALNEVGGYDSDLPVLRRLRRRGLASGAIVSSAHFYHCHTASPVSYWKKWTRRAIVLSESVEHHSIVPTGDPYPGAQREAWEENPISFVLEAPFEGLTRCLGSRDSRWLWGFVYPLIVAGIVGRHPLASFRALRSTS